MGEDHREVRRAGVRAARSGAHLRTHAVDLEAPRAAGQAASAHALGRLDKARCAGTTCGLAWKKPQRNPSDSHDRQRSPARHRNVHQLRRRASRVARHTIRHKEGLN